MFFPAISLYFPLEMDRTIHLKKLHPRNICDKFCWNLLNGYEEIQSKYFFYYLPLKIGGTLHLNKHKFPSPNNVLF